MKTKDISQVVVGFLVMLSFMVVLWALFKIEMPPSNRDLALILLGVLGAKFGDVVAYHFNSSKGSSEKTDIISKLPPVPVLLLPMLLFAMASCSTPKQLIKEVPIQYKEKVVERLVPYEVRADSSILKAWFECDSLNQVVLKQFSEQKGKLESALNFSKGQLTYEANFIHDTIWVKSDTVYKEREVPVKVTVETEVNRLTKWQAFQIMGFRIMIIALGIYIAWRYFNPISTAFKKLLKLK